MPWPLAKRSGRDLPQRVDAGDIVLIGTASYKLSRLIAKKKVTAFVRAPFTELEGKGGPAELEEHPARPRGAARAGGAAPVPLLPRAVGVRRLPRGLLFAPRATRFSASVLTAMSISDFLQIAYKAAEDRALGETPSQSPRTKNSNP